MTSIATISITALAIFFGASLTHAEPRLSASNPRGVVRSKKGPANPQNPRRPGRSQLSRWVIVPTRVTSTVLAKPKASAASA